MNLHLRRPAVPCHGRVAAMAAVSMIAAGCGTHPAAQPAPSRTSASQAGDWHSLKDYMHFSDNGL